MTTEPLQLQIRTSAVEGDMTWYRKPKANALVATSQPCFQCGRLDGTTPIPVVGTSFASASAQATLWVCPACREKLPPPDATRN